MKRSSEAIARADLAAVDKAMEKFAAASIALIIAERKRDAAKNAWRASDTVHEKAMSANNKARRECEEVVKRVATDKLSSYIKKRERENKRKTRTRAIKLRKDADY